MYISIYLYIYICIYVYFYICIYVYIYISIDLYIYISIYVSPDNKPRQEAQTLFKNWRAQIVWVRRDYDIRCLRLVGLIRF